MSLGPDANMMETDYQFELLSVKMSTRLVYNIGNFNHTIKLHLVVQMYIPVIPILRAKTIYERSTLIGVPKFGE